MKRPVQYFSQEALAVGQKLTPTQIAEFLENFRLLHAPQKTSKSKLISIKIPISLLEAFKIKAAQSGIPYQTLIKQLMTTYLG